MQHSMVICKITYVYFKKASFKGTETEKLEYRINEDQINPLQPGIAYLCPLKTSENLKVFWRFQGL